MKVLFLIFLISFWATAQDILFDTISLSSNRVPNVIISQYIQSQSIKSLSAKDLILLSKGGVDSKIILTMMQKSKNDLHNQRSEEVMIEIQKNYWLEYRKRSLYRRIYDH